jgi:threonine dehydratase
MRSLGATVVSTGADFDAAKRAARSWAADRGARVVEVGREPLFAEGAGTIAVELVASGEAFDAVVVPVGDGALVTGIARWLHAASPATRVIGVVSRGAPAMRASWQRAGVVDVEPHTIADGIAIRSPVDVALADVRALVDDLVEIDDPALVEAMRLVHTHAGLVVEPAAVAGIAAIVGDRARFAGQRVATIITGSNVTIEQMRAWGLAT